MANYGIVLSPDAISSERTAGKELLHFLSVLAPEKSATFVGPGKTGSELTFHVGQSKETAKALGLKDFSSLRPDEIILRRIGHDVYLTGARPRGTLYSVYTFLEEYCGVRFLAHDETSYPSRFVMPEVVEYRYAPPFMIRDTYIGAIRAHKEFAVRRKENGFGYNLPPELGGSISMFGFVHTFDQILPVKTYGRSHPEYYAELSGKRHVVEIDSQLCLSNREMRQEFIANVRSKLRRHPKTRFMSLSQNDNQNYCRCSACQALVKRYGGAQSGAILDFVNEVAAALESEFPLVSFETLAYGYSVASPKGIRPRGNVVIRLCSDQCDYGHALDDPHNQKFRSALSSWSQLSERILIWNYVTLFRNHVIPNPNWLLLGRNLRFFRRHHVIGVFNQGDHCGCGEFSAMRAYVNSKLLWNPDLDEQMLIDEFLGGYYGPEASPWLRKYLMLMRIDATISAPEFRLTWETNLHEWMAYETLEEARRLMRQAVRVAKGRYLKRVQMAQLSIDFAFLLHPETMIRYAERLHEPQESLRRFIDLTRGIDRYGEGRSTSINRITNSLSLCYLGKPMKPSNLALPASIRSLDASEIQVVEGAEWFLFGLPPQAERKEGYVRMSGDHKNWFVQFPDLYMRLRRHSRWQMYLELRTGGGPDMVGVACETGVYDRGYKKTHGVSFVPFSYSAGKDFRVTKIGIYETGSGHEYFYCAPCNDARATPIDIRRLFLVPILK